MKTVCHVDDSSSVLPVGSYVLLLGPSVVSSTLPAAATHHRHAAPRLLPAHPPAQYTPEICCGQQPIAVPAGATAQARAERDTADTRTAAG